MADKFDKELCILYGGWGHITKMEAYGSSETSVSTVVEEGRSQATTVCKENTDISRADSDLTTLHCQLSSWVRAFVPVGWTSVLGQVAAEEKRGEDGQKRAAVGTV
jgi:hypothetical protein